MSESPEQRFVGKAVKPLAGTFDAASMARGEPGLPAGFTLGDEEIRVVELLDKWRDTGACRQGSGERYVRRHWFRVRDDAGRELRLYCDRQPRGKQGRWWLYAIADNSEKAG